MEWKYLVNKDWISQMLKIMNVELRRDPTRAAVLNQGGRKASGKMKPGDETVWQGCKQVANILGRLQSSCPVQRKVMLTSLECSEAEGKLKH